MKEDILFLKEKAEQFLKHGQRAFKEGEYWFAAFNLEQAGQLYLKFTLASVIGDFPKTHSLKKLLKETTKASGSEDLKSFFETHQRVLTDLEEAYFTTRYFPIEFPKEKVKDMLKGVGDLVKILQEIWT